MRSNSSDPIKLKGILLQSLVLGLPGFHSLTQIMVTQKKFRQDGHKRKCPFCVGILDLLTSYNSPIQKSSAICEVDTLPQGDHAQSYKAHHNIEIKITVRKEPRFRACTKVIVYHHKTLKTNGHQTVTIKHNILTMALNGSNVQITATKIAQKQLFSRP